MDVTEHTSCGFAVNGAFVEQEAPSDPLCITYHIGQKCKGAGPETAGRPGTDARMHRRRPPMTGECIRTEGKDEDTS